MKTPTVRVLIIENFEEFRRFTRSILQKRPELQIVGEASNGLEAVQKAERMQPNLILLDIGLPHLNGFAAARQIRGLAPESKIVFVSQESSPNIVQEAFNLGARGYVVKTRAAIDLLAALDTVLGGRYFVSDGLSDHEFTDASPERGS